MRARFWNQNKTYPSSLLPPLPVSPFHAPVIDRHDDSGITEEMPWLVRNGARTIWNLNGLIRSRGKHSQLQSGWHISLTNSWPTVMAFLTNYSKIIALKSFCGAVFIYLPSQVSNHFWLVIATGVHFTLGIRISNQSAGSRGKLTQGKCATQ